jgi:hypothetical protein
MPFMKLTGFTVGFFSFVESVVQNDDLASAAAAFILIREATEDTILNVPNADNQPGTRQVPIPKGLSVIVDMIGIRASYPLNEERRHPY